MGAGGAGESGGAKKVAGSDTLAADAADGLEDFLRRCQGMKGRGGGFSKIPGNYPDVLHSHYSVCGLSLAGGKGIARLEPALCVSARALAHLHALHDAWDARDTAAAN